MKTTQRTLMVLIGLLTSAGSIHAEDYDFTFNVPLEVVDLRPDATQLKVIVTVGIVLPLGDSENKVGGGSEIIDIDPNEGSYSGIVVVEFNADQDKDPRDAKLYEVKLQIKPTWSEDQWFDPQTEDGPGSDDLKMKDGAPNNVVITDPFFKIQSEIETRSGIKIEFEDDSL